MPTFFQRRAIWLPSGWFGALLLSLMLGALVLGWSQLAVFLALDQPARGPDGRGARTLVVEGWLGRDDLDSVMATIRAGRYERIYTTGGPIRGFDRDARWPTYADRAAAYLRTQDLGGRPVLAVPAPRTLQDRTYLSARLVWEALQRDPAPPHAVDVYSSGAHARRTRAVYRLAFDRSTEIGIIAAPPDDYDPRRWWRSSAGVKAVLGEALSLVWTTCCFWPGPAVDEAHGAHGAAPP